VRLDDLNVNDVVEVRSLWSKRWSRATIAALHPKQRQSIELVFSDGQTRFVRTRDIRLPQKKRAAAMAPARSLRGAVPILNPESLPPLGMYATARTLGERGPPISRPKEDPPWRSEEYLAFVRKFPCTFASRLASPLHACDGAIEAHHDGPHPMGQKTDDSRAVPVCQRHHQMLTEYKPISGDRELDEHTMADAKVNILTSFLKSKRKEKKR